MFNVRIKKYLNTEQIQIFSDTISDAGSEREDRRKVIYDTGEIVPTNRSIIVSPFCDEEIIKPKFFEKDSDAWICKDTESVIGMNLGNEEENIKRSVRRTKNKIYDIAKSNDWEWFFTLTFNDKKVNAYDYDETTKKLSMWLNRMRKICPSMKYLLVPEPHPTSGRWHFHGLFANVENMEFVDSGHRDKYGRTIYDVGKYRFGWSEATKIDDVNKASGYITKYITKEVFQVTYNKKRYWASRNLNEPQVIDCIVEGAYLFGKYMRENSIYYKETNGYLNVTYIEVPLGDSDFIFKSELLAPSELELSFSTNDCCV